MVRSGDQLDIGNCTGSFELRTVQFIEGFRATGGNDGRNAVLNEDADGVICVTFTDGSQAVIVSETQGKHVVARFVAVD